MYRAVFISDLHLGSRHCQVKKLLKFLQEVETEELFLVGDIIDGWRLSKKWYWPNSHSKVVRQLLKMKCRVTYIPGNHDEFLRPWLKHSIALGNIQISNQHIYQSLDGRRFLVTHGDFFDYLMRSRFGRFVMSCGDIAYDLVVWLSAQLNKIRAWLGLPYWSLSKYLKAKAKYAASFVGQFEEEMANYCKRKGYDGVICGHIHTPNIREFSGITYMNDGDWCENCSALVETQEGEFKILTF